MDIAPDVYAVGMVKPELAFGNQSGVMFDIVQADSTLVSYIFVCRPNPDEEFIKKFQSAKKVGLALKYDRSQILLAIKLGNGDNYESETPEEYVMDWDDCVYDPFKSMQVEIKDIKRLCEEIPDGNLSTFAVSAFLIDSTIGKIHACHLFSPDKEMNEKLRQVIRNKINRGQDDPQKYMRTMQRIYAEYPTAADIAKRADAICWV